jgi:hypothetical protein
MGVAVFKVAKLMISEALPFISTLGEVRAIWFEAYPSTNCEIRIEVDALPEGEHEMLATIHRQRNGLSATTTVAIEHKQTTAIGEKQT